MRGVKDTQKLLSTFRSIGCNVTLPFDVDVIGSSFISIGNNFYAQQGLRIHCWKTHVYDSDRELFMTDPCLQICNDIFINRDCYINCAGTMYIGSGVVFGSNVFITDTHHGDTSIVDLNRFTSTLTFAGNIVIEDGVWIGNNVCILPGSTIGRGSIIGANSVVNSFVPPYSVAAGSPAKIKKILKHPPVLM